VQSTIARLRTQLRGKFVSRVPLLVAGVLTNMDRYWLVGKLRPWNFNAGDAVVKQGEVGDTLYIIERGTCEVIVNGNIIDTIGREDFFGELAVMYASKRSATVRARTEATLLSLSRDDLLSTISEDKLQELAIVARARLFNGVPLLSALSVKQKQAVTTHLKEQSWPPGVLLASQGHQEIGDKRRMYIILDGECRKEVKTCASLQEKPGVETLGHGKFFNMFALWYGCPCSASITTITKVTTLSISFDELTDICTQETRHRIHTVSIAKQLESAQRVNKVMGLKFNQDEEQSESMKSVCYSMWLHLLKLLFLKVELDVVASNQEALMLVCDQCTEVTFKKWDSVFTKGVPYDHVYILENGVLSEHTKDIETLMDAHELGDRGGCIQHIAPGTCFGTMCLQGKEKNLPTSTLAASQDTLMLSIPGDVLRRMLRNGSLA